MSHITLNHQVVISDGCILGLYGEFSKWQSNSFLFPTWHGGCTLKKIECFSKTKAINHSTTD